LDLALSGRAYGTSKSAVVLICDFKQDVNQILPHTPFKSVEELVKEAHRFHCSVCGAKHVTIKEAPCS